MGRRRGSKNINWSVIGLEVIRMLETQCVPEIAEELAIDPSAIRDFCKRNDISLGPRRRTKGIKVHDDDLDLIWSLRKSGLTISQIAAKWDCCDNTIYNALSREKKVNR